MLAHSAGQISMEGNVGVNKGHMVYMPEMSNNAYDRPTQYDITRV